MAEEIKGEDSCRKSVDEAVKYGNAVVVDVDDLWAKSMKEKLASKYCQPSHRFTICRVPTGIRRVDNEAYDPLIVSIGPYHRGDPRLHEMEEVKWHNLNAFLRRRTSEDFNKYLKAMKEIEPQARACYSGNIHMEANEFIEMMLLDGLFIIQLLLNRAHSFLFQHLRSHTKDEERSTISGILCRVGHDMLLLENQLPFFVLERLRNLMGGRKKYTLWKSACIFIRRFSMRFEHEWDFNILREIFDEESKTKNPEIIDADGVHHLLHLVYLFLKPTSLTSNKISKHMEPTAKLPAFIKKILSFLPPRCHWFPSPSGLKSESMEFTAKLPAVKKKILPFRRLRCHRFPSPSGQKSESVERTAKLPAVIKKILSFLPPRCHWLPSMDCSAKLKFPAVIKKMKIRGLHFLSSSSESKSEPPPPPLMVIPSAAELDEAGVKFECVGAKSFLDVKFEQGTMKMPRLSLQDPTKSLLRNFIAYEQCFPSRGSHFTSYCSFMDYLVNTPRDVEILKQSAVIENRVGCDKEVALFFNDLCKGIFLTDLRCSYLAKSFEGVTKHSQKRWPKWWAKLMRDYFGSPWSIISFFAATVVILLTIVQTYYAVFT